MGGSFSSPTTVAETAPTTGTPESSDRSRSSSQEPKSQTGPTTGTPESSDPAPNSSQDPEPQNLEENPRTAGGGGGGGGEEEGEECMFCLFMKGGNCKDVFIDWQNCVKEAEDAKDDVTTKCWGATGALFKCMDAHRGYYGEIIDAKDKLEEETTIEVEGEIAVNDSKKKEEPKDEGLEPESVKDSDAGMAAKD